MPAGTIEKSKKEKKPRTRYTTIPADDSSIAKINDAYYSNPKDEEVKNRYLRFFVSNNTSAITIYQNKYKRNHHSDIYRDLPYDLKQKFSKYFDLSI